MMPSVSRSVIYVSGHRNPDTDSIAAAIGYAELKRRIDPAVDYVPVRLGGVNAQTRWVLERSQAPEPELLPHIALRVCDVMQPAEPVERHDEPLRKAGLTMARANRDLVPILGDDGELLGVITERALARRYIRESREVSSLVDAPTAVSAIVDVLEGEIVAGEDKQVAGRVWVLSMDVPKSPSEGDVVVVGDRPDAQRRAIELGVALLVCSNGAQPEQDVLDFASAHDTTVVVSPLDSYVTGRMITLSAPCRALMDPEPLTVRPDDQIEDIADEIKEIDYRAAVVVDSSHKPIGLVTRSDLVAPEPRRVILVDHAEQSQSVPGVEQAEIVEILDHHHIGSIETTIPVRATFDPVGSTATLVIERFRQHGLEPARPTAMTLLGAVLSDTVILNSPTTTERDHAAVRYFEQALALDATEFGREMFEATSDVSEVPAGEIIQRDAKEYQVGPAEKLVIAQLETVGTAVHARREELLGAMEELRERRGYVAFALMLTDIIGHGTTLLISGDKVPAERAFNARIEDGVIELPGVMSRKKQLAPKLLAAY